MRITFLGAAGMVTGSSYLLETENQRFLIDCGLFQGREEERNQEPLAFRPTDLDAVILTHAHIDHAGRLPLLRRHGFEGPIFAHAATVDLAAIMLLDSAHIQEADVERENRKARRAGRPLREPLYTQADAKALTAQFRPVMYDHSVRLGPNLTVLFRDAGHILGSASLEFVENRNGRKTRLIFSGDLGQPGRAILEDPAPVPEADYLVLETTYGNRHHEGRENTRRKLAGTITETVHRRGNVIIPAFAVGRTQELLYELNALAEAGELPRGLKVVLDSPLAHAATEVTRRHLEVFDEEASRLVRSGDDPFAFRGLVVTETAEDSKALNNAREPMVIVAAGGMCDNGRVVHHLKHNLWRPNATVLFVGYQAEGSLGRRILEGAERVRIHGEDVVIKARIESLQGLSAHADQTQLLGWVAGLQRPPRRTFLVHGEDEARAELGRLLAERGHQVHLPVLGEAVSLHE